MTPLQPPTSFFNDRKDGPPTMIILHGTTVGEAEAERILAGLTEREVSAHFLINQTGQITQYVDNDNRAWHAGVSFWAGVTDINSAAIGIEMVCISHDESFCGDESFYTDRQMQALGGLIKMLRVKYDIPNSQILGHQDIAPSRKMDPGPNFDWAALARHDIGLWHGLSPLEPDKDTLVTDDGAIAAFYLNLATYGYDLRPMPERGDNFANATRAFQTHFLPWHVCGQVTAQSARALEILLAKKLA